MKTILSLIILILTAHVDTIAQFSTGFKSPVGFSAPNGWTNPALAFHSDDQWTTAPHQSGCNCPFVYLSWNNGQNYTPSQLFGPFGTADGIQLRGGSADTWGHNWTAAELSDAAFLLRLTNSSTLIQQAYKFSMGVPAGAVINGIEVRLEGHGDANHSNDYVDHIEVNVHYSLLTLVDVFVESVPPGVTVSIMPPANGATSLVTPGVFQCASGPPYALTAPLYLNSPECKQFDKWLKNGTVFASTPMTTITPLPGDTMTAVYTDMVPPVVVTNPSGLLNLCQGSSTDICVQPANNLTYQWLQNGIPIPNATQPCYTVNQGGNYAVVVTLLNCVSDTSLPVFVNVLPPLNISLSLPQAYCANWGPQPLSGGNPQGGTYAGPGVGGVHPNYFVNPSGLSIGNYAISYTLIDSNGCMATASANMAVVPCPGIAESPGDGGPIFLWPNPGNGILNIRYSGDFTGNVTYELTDLYGRVASRGMVSINSSGTVLEISFLPSGMYFLQLIMPEGIVCRKIIIRRD
ncbi:MAG TPA: T9SS type A sorting domain-containing protein [Bacteroidales bacterium]|nr:T9SS type A sorting domain-containing protein [Bacteroidales bacterium]HSA42258.1 T9SS type A sorting domain-containing protein [Bacteroidales bacterium]